MNAEKIAKNLISLSKAHDAAAVARAFVRVVNEHRLFEVAERTSRYLEREAAREKEKETLSITVSYKGDEKALEKKIAELLGVSPSYISTEEDETLLAGFRAKYGDRVIDASTRGKLERMRGALTA